MEQRSLAGYGPWGCKESDITQHTCTHTQDVMLAMNSALCHLISNGFTFQKKKKNWNGWLFSPFSKITHHRKTGKYQPVQSKNCSSVHVDEASVANPTCEEDVRRIFFF